MAPPEKGEFRLIGERVRIEGHFLKYVNATFVDPDGFTFEREIVRHPGAVCIVALDTDDRVLLVRQYRGPLDRYVLELPAGKLDVPGESLEACARRELIEEVGRSAAQMTKLGTFHNSPGFTDEATTCFLAQGLSLTERDSQGVEEAHMTVESVPLEAIFPMFDSGELTDAKTLIAIALTRRHLGRA